MHIVQSMRGGKDNESRFFERMKPHGVWAELFRSRFHKARARYGIDNPEFALDCNKFRRPDMGGQLSLL